MTHLDLQYRKNLLQCAFDFWRRLRFTSRRVGNGKEYLQQACDKGWEGLIAMRADSRDVHSRSRQWLKFKCTRAIVEAQIER